jgi:NDP-sugar pyrophosphorylase family protein
MQIVVICGGLATRLYPLTQKIPKSMIKFGGKPFLEQQLDLLKKNRIFDIVLCVGYKAEQIKKYFGDGKNFGVEIKYSSDKKRLLGTGGALKKAENLLVDSFLVMYGDSYLPFNFQKAIKFFKKSNKLGMMIVFKNLNKYEPSNVEVKNNLVKSYSKKRKTKKMKYIDYGVSIYRKEALKYLPKNQVCDLTRLQQTLIKKRQLLAYPAEKRFYQIGSPDGLEEFKNYIKRKTTPPHQKIGSGGKP